MTHSNLVTSTLNNNLITVAFGTVPPTTIREQLKSQGFAYDGNNQHWTATYRKELDTWLSDNTTSSDRNDILQGDCITLLPSLETSSIDCILTDPPYLVDYKDRSGRSIVNDDNDAWVSPLFDEAYRVLKEGSFCITFCALPSLVAFMASAQASGFRAVGQLLWPKRYASSKYHLAFQHEQALVFVKGKPAKPKQALPTVQKWHYTGNELHPTQKHTAILHPLIEHFTEKGDLILDPFCGSGSTAVAAQQLQRNCIGMELNASYVKTALHRLKCGD